MKKSLLAVIAVLTLIVGVGCGSGNSGGGGGGGSTSTVDLAVTDVSITNLTPAVYLWLDVLANAGPSLPDPDITLDPGVRAPVNAKFYNGDLYVAATSTGNGNWALNTGGLLIWRDYLNLTDGATPDVVVYDPTVPTVGPETLQRLAIENDVLVGSTWYSPVGLYFWDNAGSITDGQAPDVFMDDASLTITPNFLNCAQDVLLSDGRLFVASCDTGTDVMVGIWNDVQDIISGGGTTNPDEFLTDQDNFLDLGNGGRTLAIDAAGALYVGEYYGYLIYKFNDASAITSASLPDVIIDGCNGTDPSGPNDVCDLDTPNAALVVNNTLFVANRNENQDTGMNAGVVGYVQASDLAPNQLPSIRLTRHVGIGQAQRLATAGGALFIGGVELDENEFFSRSVHIYKDASTALTSVPADLTISGDVNSDVIFLEYPTGVAAIVRGTFDNFVDNGT